MNILSRMIIYLVTFVWSSITLTQNPTLAHAGLHLVGIISFSTLVAVFQEEYQELIKNEYALKHQEAQQQRAFIKTIKNLTQ